MSKWSEGYYKAVTKGSNVDYNVTTLTEFLFSDSIRNYILKIVKDASSESGVHYSNLIARIREITLPIGLSKFDNEPVEYWSGYYAALADLSKTGSLETLQLSQYWFETYRQSTVKSIEGFLGRNRSLLKASKNENQSESLTKNIEFLEMLLKKLNDATSIDFITK